MTTKRRGRGLWIVNKDWKPTPGLPDEEFLKTELAGIEQDDPQFHDRWKQAFIALVASDIPLSPRARSIIASNLYRLWFPNAARERREQRRAGVWIYETLKRHLRDSGMTPAEAKRTLAEELLGGTDRKSVV